MCTILNITHQLLVGNCRNQMGCFYSFMSKDKCGKEITLEYKGIVWSRVSGMSIYDHSLAALCGCHESTAALCGLCPIIHDKFTSPMWISQCLKNMFCLSQVT